MSTTATLSAASPPSAVSKCLPFQMLLQAGHQLDEVAGAKAVVELVDQNALPGVAAGAGRSGQGKQIGAAGDPGGGPALDRRGADLLVAEPAEQLAKPGDLLLVDAVERLRGHIAAGDAGAARRDHDIDFRVGDPRLELADDLGNLVTDDASDRDPVSGHAGQLSQGVAGTVIGGAAGIGNRQQRDVERQE